MSTMRFADEVVAKTDVDDLPQRRAKPGEKELRLATQIVESLSTDWDPSRYRDTYTDELEDLLRRRAEGEEVVGEPEAPEGGKVLDLMAALEASVRDARGGRSAARTSPAKKTPAKKTPAKKASAKKTPATKASGTTTSARKGSAKKAPGKRASRSTRAPSKRSA
jgi:DNA end-binding protein Ku